jgi:hypothetical protein
MDRPSPITCLPAYVNDWRMLEREIVTVLKGQGHHIRKNAVGKHCASSSGVKASSGKSDVERCP